MKNSKSFILSFLTLAMTLVGCGGAGEDKDSSENSNVQSQVTSSSGRDINEEITEPINIPVEYKRYDIDRRNDNPIVGFGAQMDTDIFMPWNKMTPEDEQIWRQRIEEMNLKYTRIKYFPEFCEMENDNDDPNVFDYDAPGVYMDSVEMQALYKILDICEEYDIKVDLSIYGCYNWFESYDGKYKGSWMGVHGPAVENAWVTGPENYYEYAENIVMVTKYLMDVKHYTCIWGISNISEMFIDENGVKHWDEFVKCSKIIHQKMIDEGIRDKVKLFGSSEQAGNPNYYREEFETVKDIFDVCGVGNYSFDNSSPNEAIRNYFVGMLEVAKDYGIKDYVISEFCQGKHFIDAVNKTDIDDYDAGLYISRFCIEGARAGVTAFDHYILGDTFFTNSYIHTMGLWMYRDSNLVNPGYISWAAHPEYYFYNLLCRYTDTGAYAYEFAPELKTEYDSEDPDLTSVAFKMEDGLWTYFSANNSNKNKKVAFVNPQAGRPGEMKCYKVTHSSIPEDRNCDLFESYQTVDGTDGVIYITVPANGLVAISNRI